MKYYSLNNKEYQSSFQEAVHEGLAPDSGLYFPENINPLPSSFFEKMEENGIITPPNISGKREVIEE